MLSVLYQQNHPTIAKTSTENMDPSDDGLGLPWRPIFTIERSRRPEVTVYGIVSLVTGSAAPGSDSIIATRQLMGKGDINYQLWSRSLLKPWQLLNHIHVLKAAYPNLKPEHYALFMASHSAEPGHMQLLDEVAAVTAISEKQLKCPAAAPLSQETKDRIKNSSERNARRYHNCSGKHMAYLAAVTAEGRNAGDYLVESELQHSRLKKIMAALTGRPEETFLHTTDGCQLPNYALSPLELASFYLSLLSENKPQFADSLIAPCAPFYSELGALMSQFPRTISGGNRLDYKLMAQNLLGNGDLKIVAKEGADGLLGLGVASGSKYPNGLGMCIKLSSGFDNRHMELITREVFERLGLIEPLPKAAADMDHIKTHFHFELKR
jgi:L-asparaginase II